MIRYSWFILLLLLLGANELWAQGKPKNCDDVFKLAQSAFNSEAYDKANFILDDVEACDLDGKLYEQRRALRKQVNAAIRHTLQKEKENVARYYTSEAKQALEKDDSRLAYLLAKAALKKNNKNKEAQMIYDTILPYLSDRLYKDIEDIVLSPDGSMVVFVSHKKDGKRTLNLFNLISSELQYSLHSDHELYRPIFSSDNKYLTFLTFFNDKHELNILTLDQNIKFRSFPVYNYYSYQFSLDNKFLTFFNNVKDHKRGTLNVLALDKDEPPFYFFNIKLPSLYNENVFRYSPDNKYIMFFDSYYDETANLNILTLGKSDTSIVFPNVINKTLQFSFDGKYLTFFTLVNATLTINLLSLNKNELLQKYFHNVHSLAVESDSKYVTFFTEIEDTYTWIFNVLALDNLEYLNTSINNDVFNNKAVISIKEEQGHSQILNIKGLSGNDFIQSFQNFDFETSNFNKDLVTFFTDIQEDSGALNSGTLNILALDRNPVVQTFPNTYVEYPSTLRYSYNYSPNNKFLTFFTNVKDGKGTLNVFTLNKNEPLRLIPKVNINTKYFENIRFSSDSKFLTFFTDIEEDRGTLNILALDKNELLPPFKNCSLEIGLSGDDEILFYSPDNRFLVFFTNVKDGKGTLNVLPLDKNHSLQSFSNICPVYWRDMNDKTYNFTFTLNNNFLILINCTQTQITVFNVADNKIIGPFRDIDRMRKFTLSKDNKLLLTLTEGGVLKVINLRIRPEERRAYYDKKEVLQFTKEEKAYYGIE